MERFLDASDLAEGLARDVRDGLGGPVKTLPPRYFYDAAGSALFEQITALPEYYLTRAERAILAERAPQIARLSGARTLVELGSGSSEKTTLLLDSLSATGCLRCYVPVDVSESALTAAAEGLRASYPGLGVRPVVADFHRHLALLPDTGGPRLLAFLGSTIGNLTPAERTGFLAQVSGWLRPGDALLLGTDLVKDPARLLAAYDDSAGVTAAFNRNVLRVVNRELDAEFLPESFAHVARWDAEAEWVEMRLRTSTAQRVGVRRLGLTVRLDAGEEIRTEISAKFRREGVEAELAAAGLALAAWWTDPAGDFALSLSRPDGGSE